MKARIDDAATRKIEAGKSRAINTPRQVLFASLIGTAIEFFDFYIYATAAVLVFPSLFFPASDPTTAMLSSLATFGIAFFARPIGSALFGHFGDRVGRKTTLVASLLTMGLSTILIGLLPTYHTAGLAAPVLLALCRLGQGLGLGGEWGGAVLLATENAPVRKRRGVCFLRAIQQAIGASDNPSLLTKASSCARSSILVSRCSPSRTRSAKKLRRSCRSSSG